MTRLGARIRVALVMALLALVAMAAANAVSDSTRQPDKLVILSTTDVKGKTSPCG